MECSWAKAASSFRNSGKRAAASMVFLTGRGRLGGTPATLALFVRKGWSTLGGPSKRFLPIPVLEASWMGSETRKKTVTVTLPGPLRPPSYMGGGGAGGLSSRDFSPYHWSLKTQPLNTHPIHSVAHVLAPQITSSTGHVIEEFYPEPCARNFVQKRWQENRLLRDPPCPGHGEGKEWCHRINQGKT